MKSNLAFLENLTKYLEEKGYNSLGTRNLEKSERSTADNKTFPQDYHHIMGVRGDNHDGKGRPSRNCQPAN